MTLKRRLTLQIAGMVTTVALLGIVGVNGVRSLHADLSVSLHANEQLRHIYTIASRIAAARAHLEADPTARALAADELESASRRFASFDSTEMRWLEGTSESAQKVSQSLHEAAIQLRESQDTSLAVFATPYANLADVIAATRQSVSQRQLSADANHRRTLLLVSITAILVTIGAIGVGIVQYRSVIQPLQAVRQAARRIASGELAGRADIHGDEEFAALAADFNRMAANLQALYADLEDRIDRKSRELAQSERLASVGYLAAGVAHEINNPLGIIAGHGERSLRRLERDVAPVGESIQESLRIICDEAFRCKRITDGLLDLARPDDEPRTPIALNRLLLDVVAGLSGLPRFADRRLTVSADPSLDWTVLAPEARLRQVVLNLVLNALEATDAETGWVWLILRRQDNAIEFEIGDNGKGIAADSLGRIFDPFYTEKRTETAGAAGTGLGLPIARSIISRLGGTIHVQSAGAGCGSVFTVHLPRGSAEAVVG